MAYLQRRKDNGGALGAEASEGGRSRGRGRSKSRKDVVHFCFLGREEGEVVIGDGGGGGNGNGGDGERGGKGDVGGGLFKEIRVESEIGRQEGGKQVLKNVGKVERFVLEQVRRIFEEEFVWPSFWTFLV